jgi:hypothetical protein
MSLLRALLALFRRVPVALLPRPAPIEADLLIRVFGGEGL